MHIKTVLVPVDFSPPSSLAVGHGIALARQFNARLTLLHVGEPGVYRQAERMMAALVGPEDEDDLDVEILVKAGDIEEQILSTIRDRAIDIVVMGTHGRKLISRLLIGSVTQGLLRKLPVPILTVCHVSQPLSFKRILFATDFSECSKASFSFAVDLARRTKSSLVVAHVIDKRPAVTYETPEVAALFDEEQRKARDETESNFAEVQAMGESVGVPVETVLAEGIPADAILRVADENAVDLMVVTARTRGRIERAFMGTTAERLIRESHVPVLSIPEHWVTGIEEQLVGLASAGPIWMEYDHPINYT